VSQNHRPDPEPTPEFNERCLDITAQWEGGSLPFNDAALSLAELGKEALARNHLANQGRVEQLLGYMQGYRGNLNTSIHHFERARALYMQIGNRRRVAVCDLNIGESYRYKGDFNRARSLFEKAFEAFKALDDPGAEAMAIGNKGQMLLSMGNLENAEEDLMHCLKLVEGLPEESANRTSLLCEVYHGLTLLYLARGHHDAAWQEARRAYHIAQRINRPLEKGFANRAVAEVITALDSAPEETFDANPDVYFQAANEGFREINAEGEIARTMFAHAKSLSRRGRRMTAARKLQHAMIIFTRLGMVDDAAKAAEAQLEVL
jgi:tetratricopeptide (TPR) repeat protein